MGQVGMEHVQTDPVTKKHLYKCRAEGCYLKTHGMKGLVHCDSEEWFDPSDYPRGLGNVRRNSKTWRFLYHKRWSVERWFANAKEMLLLDDLHYRGIKKVRTHVTSSVIAYLAVMLAHLQQGDVEHMLSMKVRGA